jgi:hypothetical protein
MDKNIITNSDCLFNGKTFNISLFKQFNSEQLLSIIGRQSPNGYEENLEGFQWAFQYIDIKKLKYATEYNEEPEGGWENLYLKFLNEDEEAAKYSPEYNGRDNWIKNEWSECTDTYPLFVIKENNNYRLLDGHHRFKRGRNYFRRLTSSPP